MSAKSKAQRHHARVRARERLGIELGPNSREQILQEIWKGRSTPVQRQSIRISVHDVQFEDRLVRVVYDKNRKEIVTFLDPEWDLPDV